MPGALGSVTRLPVALPHWKVESVNKETDETARTGTAEDQIIGVMREQGARSSALRWFVSLARAHARPFTWKDALVAAFKT